MAMKRMLVFVVVITITMVLRGCNGDCSKMSVKRLLPCEAAVTLNNPTNPSAACCETIKSFDADDVQCLCSFKHNSGSMLRSLGIDPHCCALLPALCNVTLPANC